MKSAAMSVKDVCEELRNAGIPASPMRVADLIENGTYNFGIRLSRPNVKKRSFLIWRADFEKWLAEKTRSGESR